MVMDAGLDNTGQNGWSTTDQDTATPETGPNPREAEPDMPDPRKLAQDWITLWQSELSAMAADPEIRESWQTVMALWAGTMSAMLRGLPHDPRGHPRPADAPRPAPAAAAPDPRDAEIDRLARHVAALEQRLAELARRVERDFGGDPPVPPKRRPKPGRKPGG